MPFGQSEAITAARHLPFPLLVIPAKARFKAIRRITLACRLQDIKTGIPVSPSFLKELKDSFGTRFEVVHFFTGAGNPAKSIVDFFHWEQSLGGPSPDLRFIEAETAEKGLFDYLASHPVDWLMLFPKRHRFLEFHKSWSKRIVSKCTVPVLSVNARPYPPSVRAPGAF